MSHALLKNAAAAIAGIALLTGLSSVRADELGDLRANQELLQKRIDQLAQAGTAKPEVAPGASAMAGSFPRSFLIPGTNTSLAIGGFVQLQMVKYFTGATPNGNPSANNTGSGGVVQGVPLDLHGQRFGNTVFNAPLFNPHSRGQGDFEMVARNSRLRVETRTPSAWGQVGTVWEMDFYGCSSGGVDCSNLNHSTNPHLPRLRLAYATVGGFIAGQNTVPVNDNAAHAELLDFGGDANFGYARAPQIGYKWASPWYGMSLAGYLVAPDTDFWSPLGSQGTDCASIAGTNCPPIGLAVNPARSNWPDQNFVVEFQQPWGHFRVGGVLLEMELQDGQFVSKQFLGYGANIAGNVVPNWFGWTKDNMGGEFWAGEGIGRYGGASGAGSSQFNNAIATNYGGLQVNGYGTGAAGTTTRENAALVRAATVANWGAQANYQHWWTPELRSTISAGFTHNEIPIDLVGTNAVTGMYTKTLVTAHLNLIWSPVSFVDTGIEYVHGHRQTLANLTGNVDTLSAAFKVKF